MRRLVLFVLVVTVALLADPVATPQKKDPYADHIAPTGPRSPEEQRKLFRLPPGFEIQLVAAEPEIKKPININFDAKSRLWVTHSVEYPFAAKAGQPTRDSVRIMADFGPDGRAQKVTTFADNLNIPIGVLPQGDGAIVYTIPHIMRLRDTTGAGKADQREVLYKGYGYADTHGMTGEFVAGFDGWIYACHGFSNTSKVEATSKQGIEMQSGNTYRIKADGSKIEYFTHGQVNPFGLAFDPLGNLYSCDCHTQPVYQLLQGAWYPSFGKPHDGLGFGPEMLTKYKGSTAISGIVYYAAEQFPKEFRDTIFFGDVVTNQIMQVKFKLNGTTPKTTSVVEFLGCSDKWFRPVDIKLGSDGALYVADFYTPIVGHYEVPLNHPKRDNQHGRIWRIVYKGTDAKNALPPLRDFTQESLKDLVDDLADPNLSVRLTATNQLVERGGKPSIALVQQAVAKPRNSFQQAHGLWVLARQDALADETLDEALHATEALVRVHALRILAERKELAAHRQRTLVALADSDTQVRRAAAAALGAHPDVRHLTPLLECLGSTPPADNHFVHVLRMALRDQLKNEDHFAGLRLLKVSDRDRLVLADVCLGLSHVASAQYLLEHMESLGTQGAKLPSYVRHMARYGAAQDQVQLVSLASQTFPGNWALQGEVFRALSAGLEARGAKLDSMATRWGSEVAAKLMRSPNQKQAILGIELAAVAKAPALKEPLQRIVLDPKSPEAIRKPALTSLLAIDAKGAIATLGQVLSDAGSAQPVREQAAAVLGSTNQPEAHAELLKALATAPAKLETTFAMHLAKSPIGAEKLLQAIAAGKASPRLLQAQSVLVTLQQAKVQGLDQRLKQLTKGLQPADVALLQLLEKRRLAWTKTTTELEQGVKVFEKHCANCHQIGGKGAKIGPNLDGLGLRGIERIIEDILDPNRNVDQAFRSTHLTLKNGQLVQGLLLREEGAVLVMADAQGKEVRVTKDQVDEQRVSPLSPMPANFAEQIGEQDFAHLLGYLLSQRPASKE